MRLTCLYYLFFAQVMERRMNSAVNISSNRVIGKVHLIRVSYLVHIKPIRMSLSSHIHIIVLCYVMTPSNAVFTNQKPLRYDVR